MGLRTIKEVAVESLPTTVDHTSNRGYFVKVSSGNSVLCTSATDVPYGLILDGEAGGGRDSVAISGGNIGSVRVKVSGNVTKTGRGKLAADASAVAAGTSGARTEVCIFMEDGASGELVEAVIIAPVPFAA